MQSIRRRTGRLGPGATASVATASDRVVPLDDALPLRRRRSPVRTRGAENRRNPAQL